MAPYKRIQTSEEPVSNNELVSRFLDRSGIWQSFSCQVKMKLEIGDTTLAAKGTLLYMSPEKYSLSFARPYNQVIGDLYVTPQQLMYWGNGKTKLFYSETDTVHIPELIPMAFPDWDPRDLLPFPVSGRTAGFQVVSEHIDSLGSPWIQGECGQAVHSLNVNQYNGTIVSEKVSRCSTDYVNKSYRRYYSLQGWPVSTRVTCKDESGRVKLTWSLHKLDLKSPDFSFEEQNSSQLTPNDHE